MLGSYGASAAPKQIRTVIGTGVQGHAPDGTSAGTATLDQPYGVYVDQENAVYWADFGSDRVLMLRRGAVSVVAGNGTKGHAGDGGLATLAQLARPHEVRFDRQGNMLVAERDANVIRMIAMRLGSISTLVGTGMPGFGGDGGPSEKALLRQPHSIALDRRDNLYICDIQNNRVRCRDAVTGLLTTFAGNGETADTPDEASLAAPLHGQRSINVGPDGTMYLILREGNKVFSINPACKTLKRIAGTGAKGYAGDKGPARDAQWNGPKGIAYSPDGNLTSPTRRTTSSGEFRCMTGMSTRSQARACAATDRTAIRLAVPWRVPTASLCMTAFSILEMRRIIASVPWKSENGLANVLRLSSPFFEHLHLIVSFEHSAVNSRDGDHRAAVIDWGARSMPAMAAQNVLRFTIFQGGLHVPDI